MKYQEIKEQICDVCNKMWIKDWVAANDGNVSVKVDENTVIATPTGISKSFITPDKLVTVDMDGNLIDAQEGYRPSSELKMHLCCYKERPDVGAVVHAHPIAATAFAVAHVHMDKYVTIEDVITVGCVPITPYGTPSTDEVPNAIRPFLPEHDVLLLENHGALSMGADLITAYYRMESLEHCAKVQIYAELLGGAKEISKPNIDTLISMRGKYGVTGKHPGYKKYNK